MSDDSKASIWLALLLSFVLCAPINAFAIANTAGLMWDWFLRAEYGIGPSTKAWYGLSVIIPILRIKTNYSTNKNEHSPLELVFISIFATLFLCGAAIASAWVVRLLMGW